MYSRILLILGLLSALFIMWPSGIRSAEVDSKSLQKQVDELKAKVSELETLKGQLKALEQKLKDLQNKQKPLEEDVQEVKKAQGPIKEVVDKLAKKQKELAFNFGGALRFNYYDTDYNHDNRDRGGDMAFDIFRLNVDGSYKDFLLSAEYRWYSYQNVIQHGWIGYNFTDKWQGKLGITEVPFGLLPYASHNYWFSIPYYVGHADDWDMGFKLHKKSDNNDPWDLQLAFFKNAEWGSPSKLARYSYDVVEVASENQFNSETNQLNGRLAYVFHHGDLGTTEIGVSGQWGQLYNSQINSSGYHWAAAAHVNGHYGHWNPQLEIARYKYHPDNPAGVSDDFIQLGAFEDSYPVVAHGTILVANLAYDLPIDWGPISNLTFYDDYSVLLKDKDGYPNSHINTLGCLITSLPIYTYVDFIMGKNMIYLGGAHNSLAAGGSDTDWHLRFNINMGYYF
jgi:hypothetical protein